ncbi:polysaccharide biosynthesis protein [Aureimonas endophytica]|uniref:Polysaccharide biosynthesis protein n=2 Tax=Aureimonas endophytica TaxID=2027858 RepID=A0A917E434_9HYPH|nr:polysaccharide biosynthesis protein [Aureimonas endophytica]
MRSVVEAYERDGFIADQDVRLIHSYVDGGVVKRQWVLVQAIFAFLLCLARNRVELVHCHAAMRGSFWRKSLFAAIARRFGIPVVLHLHGSEMKTFYNSQKPFVQRLIRGRLERATRVVVLSKSWEDFVSAIAPRARITVVPNYVTVPAEIQPQPGSEKSILFLGLVGQRKGAFDLIEAFRDVAAAEPAARLTIGGNGETEKAGDLVRDFQLDGVIRLAGWVDGAAKQRLVRESAVYVLPSHNEGLPMSVLEAMAAGQAVVTTRVGGIPELITSEEHGLLFDAGDRSALSQALRRLLSDGELRDRLAAAGRRRVETAYSDKVVLPMLAQLYAECAR